MALTWLLPVDIAGENPANSRVSTSDNLTGLPPPLLPVHPLAAPANTEVSLPLELMKATVQAENYSLFIILHHRLYSPAMSTGSSQVGAALFPSF